MINIRIAKKEDIENILKTFSVWHKTEQQFIDYLAKQDRDESILIIALTQENTAIGYANLFWQSRITWHREQNIPEIVDLNVITDYQRKGVATKMIQYLEKLVLEKGIPAIGIAVEPTLDYLPASKLYHKLGYQEENKNTVIDGEKVLVMNKHLSKETSC